MIKRKPVVKATSKTSHLSSKAHNTNNYIFGSWSIIHRDPHPESRDTKLMAANQNKELKFG